MHWCSVPNDIYIQCPMCLFLFQLVLAAMRHHTDSPHVQLVASACVFNLTVQELVLGMPLRLLGNVVQQLLTAMKNFPNHEQVYPSQVVCTIKIKGMVQNSLFESFQTSMSFFLLLTHKRSYFEECW